MATDPLLFVRRPRGGGLYSYVEPFIECDIHLCTYRAVDQEDFEDQQLCPDHYELALDEWYEDLWLESRGL